MTSTPKLLAMASACVMVLGAAPALTLPAHAQTGAAQPASARTSGDVQEQIARSAAAIEQMKADPKVAPLLKVARGIFVVPAYVRAGLGVGVRGGEGILLVRQGQEWTSPLFYNLGGVSIGLQAGAETGPVVMLLMNDKAVNEFRKENNFALNADAGLTLVNYNASARAGAGQGDVIVWTNTRGAFATAAVGVVDIHFDDADTRAYYRKSVKAADVLNGSVKDTQPGVLAQSLKAATAK
ncbi:lipid-binding SYLF domain-containing protein [Massilia sp. CCM 9210]|uniref:lipid-binding SYLF domain-containing protein n=1 Tax=Massilia scottii TaxID=3057166 RepID=UPI0027969867|nr:lipid-binding SYLF domain-containing protein [Massilia sp. CCM 9210]MDQ1812018.1 lipid-binding SYLF domain-containing protein [Massilia sp. CCM 9210]